MPSRPDKPLRFLFDSKAKLDATPEEVQDDIGFAFDLVQRGEDAPDFSAVPQYGRGVIEIRASHDGEAYRSFYVAKFAEAVYVLDVVHKKSKRGKQLPKADGERIARRFKQLAQRRRSDRR